jgi:hypothetical protein
LINRYIYLHLYDIFNFLLGKDIVYLEGEDDLKSYIRHTKLIARERHLKFLKNFNFYELDIFELRNAFNTFVSVFFKISDTNIKLIPRYIYRIKNYNYKPYINFYNTKDNKYSIINQTAVNIYSGLKSI